MKISTPTPLDSIVLSQTGSACHLIKKSHMVSSKSPTPVHLEQKTRRKGPGKHHNQHQHQNIYINISKTINIINISIKTSSILNRVNLTHQPGASFKPKPPNTDRLPLLQPAGSHSSEYPVHPVQPAKIYPGKVRKSHILCSKFRIQQILLTSSE